MRGVPVSFFGGVIMIVKTFTFLLLILNFENAFSEGILPPLFGFFSPTGDVTNIAKKGNLGELRLSIEKDCFRKKAQKKLGGFYQPSFTIVYLGEIGWVPRDFRIVYRGDYKYDYKEIDNQDLLSCFQKKIEEGLEIDQSVLNKKFDGYMGVFLKTMHISMYIVI